MCACDGEIEKGREKWNEKKERKKGKAIDFFQRNPYIKILGEWMGVNHRICLYHPTIKNSTKYIIRSIFPKRRLQTYPIANIV